jgi:hypothetical protein
MSNTKHLEASDNYERRLFNATQYYISHARFSFGGLLGSLNNEGLHPHTLSTEMLLRCVSSHENIFTITYLNSTHLGIQTATTIN